MKRALCALLLLLSLHGLAHADTFGVSIQLQQDQIVADAKNGLLRPAEVQSLTDKLNRIKFEYKRAKSRGVLNHYDRLTLDRMLSENEAAILQYRQNKRK